MSSEKAITVAPNCPYQQLGHIPDLRVPEFTFAVSDASDRANGVNTVTEMFFFFSTRLPDDEHSRGDPTSLVHSESLIVPIACDLAFKAHQIACGTEPFNREDKGSTHEQNPLVAALRQVVLRRVVDYCSSNEGGDCLAFNGTGIMAAVGAVELPT